MTEYGTPGFSGAQLIEKARAFFTDAASSHDWEHTRRVCRLSRRIAQDERVDIDVLLTASYLHDIGRRRQDQSHGKICHAREGAQMALPVIRSLPLDAEQCQNVLHCIRSHRFRSNEPPQTPEARVLFDADKLDAIGAVGVARAFQFAGELGALLHNPGNNVENSQAYSREDTGYREYRVKLIKIRDRMLTPTGRKLAELRHQFMVAFFDRFLEEIDGRF